MKLRSMAATAVIGAVVFTAVPAAAVPFTAYACGGSTLCQDEDPGDGEGGGDSGDWGGGDWGGGDWGGEGGDGGGGDAGDGGGDWSDDPGDAGEPGDPGDPGDSGDHGNPPSEPSNPGIEILDGPIGEPIDATLPEVVVTGHAIRPATPPSPGIATSPAGGGAGAQVRVHSRGKVWEERGGKCYRNQSPTVEAKYSRGITYTLSTQTSTNISATALGQLTNELNTQLNTTVTETYNSELTLKPGESWALFVEYQTNVYAITTHDFWGNYSTEFVNVTAPTGIVTGRAC